MKYKVGDRVRIKSIDWYNRHTNGTEVNCKHYSFICNMKKYCGQIMTISNVRELSYDMIEDDGINAWTDEMIEGLVKEETKPNIIEEAQTYWDSIKDAWICPDGYQFKDENGNVIHATKIVLEKKKKEYPKTYEECCEVLSIPSYYKLKYSTYKYGYHEYTTSEKLCLLQKKLNTLGKLLICRDAYWKIAGEEMGLGKPWEPDWDNVSDKYCIYFVSGYAWSKECQTRQCPFAFPTPEMRDAFKENFDPDIEFCKELL